MVEITETEKHVVFDDDGHSSSSDGEGHDRAEMELQVTFDPGKTHRRKSSLDVMHVAMPSWKQPKKKTDCMVHQFLESQLRAQDPSASSSSSSSSAILDNDSEFTHRKPSASTSSKPEFDTHPVYSGTLEPVQEASSSTNDSAEAPTFPPQSDMPVRPKPRALSTGNLGQSDQQAWADKTLHKIVACDDFDENGNLPIRAAQPIPSAQMDETLTSRLLTKKQLSEMAWGVRELSRRLGSIRLKPKVKSLFILTKIHDRDLIPKTRDLALWLLSPERNRRYTIYVEDRLKDDKRFDSQGLIQSVCKEYAAKVGADEATCFERVNKQLRYWSAEACVSKPHLFDFVITLGGDGTVLFASWLFQGVVPPVISFALGSLGFMTKFDFADYQSILTGPLTRASP
ncbi:unnamed protein product [Parascedosporium putredinis]|uniref:NAD(+) kinase n=1 Tax=Parascedosporium putredinis TaxID=1442378 RepID=A0A9P1GTW2_9PEZI|nr:unnamed protein product [Parascedosporium putredinis]CAI7987302.1 unnamed protein product [Parascedosporium putredinis]